MKRIQKGANTDKPPKEDIKLSVAGGKLQGKAGKEPQKPGYEPSARGTQKRNMIKETKAIQMEKAKVSQNQIIAGSELEQLRSYNQRMQQQRDEENQSLQQSQSQNISSTPQVPVNESIQALVNSVGPSEQPAPSVHSYQPQQNIPMQQMQQMQQPQQEESITQLRSQSMPNNQSPRLINHQQYNQPQQQPIQNMTRQDFSTSSHWNHQHSIIGGNTQSIGFNDPKAEKAARQQRMAEELQQQIQEREQARVKDEIRRLGKLPKYAHDISDSMRGQRNQQISSQQQSPQRNQMSYPPNQQQPSQTLYNNTPQPQQPEYQAPMPQNRIQPPIEDRPSNQQAQQPAQATMYSPIQTKADFPTIMTRGRVTDGRLDLELEKQGSIFGGRDEKAIMNMKKEEQRRAMQIELQKQIEEKQRKKDIEKEKQRLEDIRDEQRVRNELQQVNAEFERQGSIEQTESFKARNTVYENDQNHHQMNVIGPGAGKTNVSPHTQYNPKTQHMIPQNEQAMGGLGKVQNSPIKRFDDNPKIDPPQEESIGGLIGKANQPQNELMPQLPDMSSKPTQAQTVSHDDRSSEINQLSDMVKNLLSEQENLKSKLAIQEEQLKNTFQNKKEETINEPNNSSHRGVQRSKPKMNVPKGRFPTSASQKDHEKKTLAEQRRLQKQEEEKAKLDAIEAKIEKARLRIEEKKNQKSEVARQTRPKLMGGPGKQSNSSLLPPRNPKKVGREALSQNDDLADFMDENEINAKPPLAAARNKQFSKREIQGNKKTLVSAGISASRKALFDNNSNEAQSHEQQPLDNRGSDFEKSPIRNLDDEGISQLTYPNQHAQQFMPRDQARQLQNDMDVGFLSQQQSSPMRAPQQVTNTQYDGIFYDQKSQDFGSPIPINKFTGQPMQMQFQNQPIDNFTNYTGGQLNNPQYLSMRNSGYNANMSQKTDMNFDFDQQSQGNQFAPQQQQPPPIWLSSGFQNNQYPTGANSFQGQFHNNGMTHYNMVQNQMNPQQLQFQQSMQSRQPFMTSYGESNPMDRQMMVGLGRGNMGSDFQQRKFDSFEQEFMMPPDIDSIDSDINKISALTPFSEQYMPNPYGSQFK